MINNNEHSVKEEHGEPYEISFDDEMKELTHQIVNSNKGIRCKEIPISNCTSQDGLVSHCLSYSNELLKSIYDQHTKNAASLVTKNSMSTDYQTKQRNIQKNVWNKLYYKGIIMKQKQIADIEKTKRIKELIEKKECSFHPVITSIKYHSRTNSHIWKIDNFMKNFKNQLTESSAKGINNNQYKVQGGQSSNYEIYRKISQQKSNRKTKNINIILSKGKEKKDCKSKVIIKRNKMKEKHLSAKNPNFFPLSQQNKLSFNNTRKIMNDRSYAKLYQNTTSPNSKVNNYY